MDDLIQSVLREIAFDGDYGCDASRLTTFISNFYAKASDDKDQVSQKVDDDFRALVWSFIVQQPKIRVGFKPEGVKEEVYIAPNAKNARDKGAKRQKKVDDRKDDGRPPLECLPREEVESSSLQGLLAKYGSKLRIAVDEDTCFEALTGSHLRLRSLTPMVYTALQLIARTRDEGLTFVDIDKATNYTAGTVFYLVKQLETLGLVKKLTKVSKFGSQMAVHKHFYDTSPFWSRIQQEERDAINKKIPEGKLIMDARARSGSASVQPEVGPSDQAPADDDGDNDSEDDAEDAEDDAMDHDSVLFDPIDARHLGMPSIIIGRVARLLLHSKDHTRAQANLVVRIGFARPTKKERRRFNKIVGLGISKGIFQRIWIPKKAAKAQRSKVVWCLRLAPEHANLKDDASLANLVSDDDLKLDGAEEDNIDEMQKTEVPGTSCLATLPLQKQLVALIDEAGADGMTHSQLTSTLGFWDKRSVEHQLEKMTKEAPPPHLSDLGIISLIENFGRERRLKHYTTRGYALLQAREGITDEERFVVDKEHVSGFAIYSLDDFYKDEADLDHFLATYTPKRIIGTAPKAAKKKPVLKPLEAKDVTGSTAPKAPRAPRGSKMKVYKNPVGPDGKPRKGRPRNDWHSTVPIRSTPKKRDREEPEEQQDADEKKSKKRRKKGSDATAEASGSTAVSDVAASTVGGNALRGTSEAVEALPVTKPSESLAPAPKKNGRPRKEVNSLEETGPTGGRDPESAELEKRTVKQSRKRKAIDLAEDDTPAPISKRAKKNLPTSAASPVVDSISAAPTHPPVEKTPIAKSIVTRERIEPPTVAAQDKAVLAYGSAPAVGADVPDVEMDVSTPVASLVPLPKMSHRRPRRTNITYVRRAQELLETIKRLGGVTYVGNHLARQHQLYVESLIEAGERPPDTATLMDKKTMYNVLDDLVRSKDVKLLTSPSTAFGGPMRASTYAFLLDMPEDQVNDYRIRVEDQMRVLNINWAVSNTHNRTSKRGRDKKKLALFGDDVDGGPKELTPAEARGIILDQEPRTVAQLYGFVLGIFWRARELHLYTLQDITGPSPPDHIVSLSQRIVDCDYFFECLPVGTWCGLVPLIQYDAALEAFLHTPEGPDTLLRDAPPAVHMACGSRRARPKGKLCKVLQALAVLGIVTPLEVSTGSPDIVCDDIAPGRPRSFRKTTILDLQYCPLYFRFNTRMPVYDFRFEPAPFLGVAQIATVEESFQLWNLLENMAKASAQATIEFPLSDASPEDDFPVEVELVEVLQHFNERSGWEHTYQLSDYQKDYIRYASAPNAGDDPAVWLQELSYAIVAPQDTVHAYLESLQTKVRKQAEVERQPSIPANEIKEVKAKPVDDVGDLRRFLAVKATEAKQVLEESWDVLVKETAESLVPGTYQLDSPGLAGLRSKWWARGGQVNLDNYRDQIISVITGTALPLVRGLERRFRPAKKLKALRGASGAADDAEEVSVDENDDRPHCSLCERELGTIRKLIEQQAALVPADQKVSKGKKPKKPDDGTKVGRQKRYVWTPEYDQLAIDADAVLRGRSMGRKMIDTSILTRVFPLVTNSGVRNRIMRLHSERPGGAAYSRQLATAWEVLRSQPDSDVLDPYPDSLNHFPIESHIAYLRAHLDKTKLGVPADEGPVHLHASRSRSYNLPRDVFEIDASWDVVEPTGEAWKWDFLWNVLTEDLREKAFHHEALIVSNPSPSQSEEEMKTAEDYICEAAVKMAVFVPEDEYDEPAAGGMLQALGEEHIQAAFTTLIHDGVLIKAVGEKKLSSGRGYVISEAQALAISGPLSWRIFRDAELLEKELLQDDSEPWSLMATDGKTAGLLTLISEDLVDLTVDHSSCTVLNVSAVSNNRRFGDDKFENNIYVTLKDDVSLAGERARNDVSRTPANTSAGGAHDGHDVKCGRTGGGPIDCPTCIATSFIDCLASLSEADRADAQRLYDFVSVAQERGVSVPELEVFCETSDISLPSAREMLAQMTRCPIPILSVVGYDSGLLISSTFLKSWNVRLAGKMFDMTYPRRWMDATGKRCEGNWQSVLRCVLGWISVRPGISEALLRKRVAVILDRAEMNDILQFLLDRGFAIRKDSLGTPVSPALVGFSTPGEEGEWHWHIGEVSWYRVH